VTISVLPPHFQLLGAHTDQRHDWSHIVAGGFLNSSSFSNLFFYSQNEGIGEFYETDGKGGLTFLKSYTLPRSLTHVVPGAFAGPPLVLPVNYPFLYSGLFVYDQQARSGMFYETQRQAFLTPLFEFEDNTHAWTHIVSGHLTNSYYSDLLFYDQLNGAVALYSTDGSGSITLLAEYSNWNKKWTHIFARRFRVAGGISDEGKPVEGREDIFFYEGSTGYSEIYEVNDLGEMNLISTVNLDSNAEIIPGSFGNGLEGLFTYDRNNGRGTIVDCIEVGSAQVTPNHKIQISAPGEILEGLRKTWDIIVPGDFWVADKEDHHFREGGFTDFLFYDRDSGLEEFYLYEPLDTGLSPFAGYSSAGSVRPGEMIDFFVKSQIGAYSIKVFRQSADEVFMVNIPKLPTAPNPLTISRTAWRDGAQWPAVGRLTIPSDWPSGLYFARVESTEIRATLDIPFIVRAVVDGSQSKILVVMNDTTYEAYNFWGGRSHYGLGFRNNFYFTSPGSGSGLQPWAFRVSFRRPTWAAGEKNYKWVFWEVPLIRWLARQGIQVEWCTMVDLHKEPNLLANYVLFVDVGHSEYWSKEMRDNVIEFVNRGGNAAFFTGNTCWWRVRIENDGNTMLCYKNEYFDPTNDPSTRTINWPDHQARELTGVSWSRIVWDFKDDPTNEKKERAQYIVQDATHWVFANTDLQNSDRFGLYYDADGKKQTVVMGETDANIKPPSNFQKLALATYQDSQTPEVEAVTMGIFTRGGTVFTASSEYWTRGLGQNEIIDRITRNVFDRLGNLRIHVRESLDLVGKAASITQLAHQHHETFPLSLREFVERIGNL
jgi:hypothetical protein